MSDELRRQQLRRVRRTTTILALLALAIYAGYIVLSVQRSHG